MHFPFLYTSIFCIARMLQCKVRLLLIYVYVFFSWLWSSISLISVVLVVNTFRLSVCVTTKLSWTLQCFIFIRTPCINFFFPDKVVFGWNISYHVDLYDSDWSHSGDMFYTENTQNFDRSTLIRLFMWHMASQNKTIPLAWFTLTPHWADLLEQSLLFFLLATVGCLWMVCRLRFGHTS